MTAWTKEQRRSLEGIRRQVDGVLVDVDAESLEVRQREARWYCETLWADQQGIACLCFGHDPHIDSKGKYVHRGWFPRFYRWPSAVDRMLEEAMARAPGGDVYVAPALRTSQSRAAGTAAPGRWLWADVDGVWTAERERKWQAVLTAAPGSFSVLSGSGGRHLYVKRDEVLDVDERESLNRRLAAHFEGDAKWDGTAVLRLPGRWNNKGPARGDGPAQLVRVVRP